MVASVSPVWRARLVTQSNSILERQGLIKMHQPLSSNGNPRPRYWTRATTPFLLSHAERVTTLEPWRGRGESGEYVDPLRLDMTEEFHGKASGTRTAMMPPTNLQLPVSCHRSASTAFQAARRIWWPFRESSSHRGHDAPTLHRSLRPALRSDR